MDESTVCERIEDTQRADIARLAGELAGVKGENVQLRQRLEQLGGEDHAAAFLKLEQDLERIREQLEDLDQAVIKVMELADVGADDVATALYRLGKIHSICASTEELHPPTDGAETD
jgi:hypothetical protein